MPLRVQESQVTIKYSLPVAHRALGSARERPSASEGWGWGVNTPALTSLEVCSAPFPEFPVGLNLSRPQRSLTHFLLASFLSEPSFPIPFLALRIAPPNHFSWNLRSRFASGEPQPGELPLHPTLKTALLEDSTQASGGAHCRAIWQGVLAT